MVSEEVNLINAFRLDLWVKTREPVDELHDQLCLTGHAEQQNKDTFL